MARTIRVTWSLPTTRESGKPLNPADIANVELFISADLGVNYGLLDQFAPTVLETEVNELEAGEWFFQGVVVDTDGRRSQAVTASIVVPDETPPGPLTLNLELGA